MTPDLYSKYFAYDDDCRRHDKYKCSDCNARVEREVANILAEQKVAERREQMKNEPPKAIAIVPLDVNDDADSACQKARAIESFERQVQMVQTVFGYTDEEMGKIKVAQLQRLVVKAQQDATVEHMNHLLKRPGFIERLRCKIS